MNTPKNEMPVNVLDNSVFENQENSFTSRRIAMKNNMTCRKTKLAIAALVFALAGIASSASAGSIQETESQVQYPDAQTLLDMYRGGLESGKLDASLKVDAPTLPMLKVFYELLQEQAMTKEQRADLGPLGLSTDKNSKAAWNCRDETILCLAASAAMVELDVVQGLRVLACGSAALGRNQDSPKFTADCLPILNEGSNACSHANVTCGVVAQPMVTASPHAGSTNATNSYVETKTCASAGGHIGGDRIVKIGAKWGTIGGRTRITTLMATCSSGNTFTVGANQTTGVTSLTKKCEIDGRKVNRLPQGLRMYYANGGFHRMQVHCDEITSSSNGFDIYLASYGAAIYGDTPSNVDCAEGKFPVGIMTYSNKNPIASRFLVGVNLLCK